MKNPQIDVRVLSFEERSYQGKDGTSREFREILVSPLGGKGAFKFRVAKGVNLSNFEGADCTLDLEFYTFGDSISANVRVVAARELSV